MVDSSAGGGSDDGRVPKNANPEDASRGEANQEDLENRDPSDQGEKRSWVGAVGSRADRVARSAAGAGTGDKRGAAYQGAFEAVFAILIGTGIGYWADDFFGTEPRYLIIGAIVGFAAFVLRLLRLGKQFANDEAKGNDRSGPAS